MCHKNIIVLFETRVILRILEPYQKHFLLFQLMHTIREAKAKLKGP